MTTAIEIIRKVLVDGGYDGLFNKRAGKICYCYNDDLANCGGIDPNCKPGYVIKRKCCVADCRVERDVRWSETK